MENEKCKSSENNAKPHFFPGGIALVLVLLAGLIGGVIGRMTAPAPKMEGVIVT